MLKKRDVCQECFSGCTLADDWYRGRNVLTDNVPETERSYFWAADRGNVGYKFRISFSCPKTISSVTMRNSVYFSFCSTKGRYLYDVRIILGFFLPPSPCHVHNSRNLVPFVCFLGTSLPHPLQTSYKCAPSNNWHAF